MSLLLACEQGDKYSSVFNFDIEEVEEPSETTALTGEVMTFTGDSALMFDDVVAYDSILLSWQMQVAEGFFYKIYNLNNNEFIGKFCRQGRASNEFLRLAPFQQLLTENGQLKAYVYDAVGQKTAIWNIAESIKQGKTVNDSLILNQGQGGKAPYSFVFYLPNQRYIAHAPVYYSSHTHNPPPSYQLRSAVDEELIHKYDLYTKIITDGEHPSLYLQSQDRIKPDNSKVVMAMYYFPQINILDLKTNEVKGFRIDNGHTFDPGKLELRFASLDVNDNYIYALYKYRGEESFELLYQFDWDGNLVSKFTLDDSSIMAVTLDRSGKSNAIYGVSMARDNNRLIKYNLSK